MLRQMIPDDISLIDTGAAVARQLQRLLAERERLAEGPARTAQFWTSADPVHFANILPILWNNAGVVRSFEG
jgi:glutamate racemase